MFKHHDMQMFNTKKNIFGSTEFYFSGFEKPSAIQQRSIKPIVKGRDVIAQYVWFISNPPPRSNILCPRYNLRMQWWITI